MLSVLVIIAFVYPFVYVIRRFILKEARYTGDADGDMDTVPVKGLAFAVAAGLTVLALAIQLLVVGNGDTTALTATVFLTAIVSYRLMRW